MRPRSGTFVDDTASSRGFLTEGQLCVIMVYLSAKRCPKSPHTLWAWAELRVNEIGIALTM